MNRRVILQQLLQDPAIHRAIVGYERSHNVSPMESRVRVEHYVDEIVPFFDVLSYYKFGYNLARMFLGLLYKVTSEYQDHRALDAIPRNDVVIYLMNHRSNADYVVVAYVLAHGVSISYAVGEWARVWPLEYMFKSFGAYFVRRGFRDPLYHAVLERYVQLITRNGVTQGIFLEGGLTRTGALRKAKIGLLDYSLRVVREPEFNRDLWLVPVAINYDRVLEDRTLIKELIDHHERPGRLRQFVTVLRYFTFNLGRLVAGRLKRYGRVAVNFGTPISVKQWCAARPHVFELPKEKRLPILQELADEVLARVADIMPVTPVPLVAAALLSFNESIVPRAALLERLDEYRDHLRATRAKLVSEERGVDMILDRAWKMLRLRRLVLRDGDGYVIRPSQRPLLEYYANSVVHLLPQRDPYPVLDPAMEPDESLPKLQVE